MANQLQTCGLLASGLKSLPEERQRASPLATFQEVLDEAVLIDKLLQKYRDKAKSTLVRQKAVMPRLRMLARCSVSFLSARFPLTEGDLLVSGLELEKSKRVRTGAPGAPTELRAKVRAGIVTVIWRSPMRRSIFTVEYAEGSPTNGWQEKENVSRTLKARFTLMPATPGVLYWFRVKAMNPNGHGPWSSPISVRAI